MIGKVKIGVDIDGVVAYMLDGIRVEARERFGVNFSLCDVTRFSLKPQGLNRKQIVNIIEDNTFLIRLPVIYYAKQALDILIRDFEVHLVSARSREVYAPTEIWLYKNEIPYDYLMIGHDCKYNYAKENNLPFFVEDRYRNALKLTEFCGKVFLLNKTYNMGREVPDKIQRVESWHDILRSLYDKI